MASHNKDEDYRIEDLIEEEENINRKTKLAKRIFLLSLACVIIVAVWFVYHSTYKIKLTPEEIPIIKSDNQATKIKPEDPGGMVISNMDKTIYDSLNNKPQTKNKEYENTISAPEEPMDTKKIVSIEPEIIENKSTLTAVVEHQEDIEKIVKPLPEEKKKQFSKNINNKNKSKGYKVQLGAFRSEDLAINQWNNLKGKYPKILGGLSYSIEKKNIKNKGIFYRLQAGNFLGESEARLLCKKLINLKQGCFIVK